MTAAHRIVCGACNGVHHTVDAVRACCAGSPTWACTWLVDRGLTEDGDPLVLECGSESWLMPNDRGYECASGHSHVYCEARAAEGWDYASDEEEAAVRAKYGHESRLPDGRVYLA